MKRLVLVAAVLASTAWAEEFDGVATQTLLSDEAFFALATCGAPPGGACSSPTVRWRKPVLTLSVLPGKVRSSAAFSRRLNAALDHAIAQINGAGAAIRIRRVPGKRADIRVTPSAVAEGTELTDVPHLHGAGIMGVGYMTLWWNTTHVITEASILISVDITDADLQSVMLEELFQALGPRFDVEGAVYEGVSILSQTSNATTEISGQDARLLRWLYPAQE